MHRVLNVIHYPVFGGPHNQALRLSRPLTERGFETVTVLPDEAGNAAVRLRAGGVETRTIRLHRLRATRDPRIHAAVALNAAAEIAHLRTLMQTCRISVVQLSGLVNPHAAVAAHLEGLPVVWQLLDSRAPGAIAHVAMYFVDRMADVVMSTGVAIAKAHPRYQAIADRLVTYFPPVDLERFAPSRASRQDVRFEWGVAPTDLVVGCVANVNPQKGITELIEAFALARSAIPAAKLVVVGAEYATHAAYSDAVRHCLIRAGLTEGHDVIFTGEREDVERQLSGMDVFGLAATPRSEGITTAVLEAMAAELPVIVTDVGALREAIDDPGSGFVIPPGDTSKFAGKLIDLLRDPQLRASTGSAARVVAQSRFGANHCADTHAQAYERALAARGRGTKIRDNFPTPNRRAPRRVDGIPVYLTEVSPDMHDDLDHQHGRRHKHSQAAHFDRGEEEAFEVSRPHGTPRLYRFLLEEKARRALDPVRRQLVGASALVVCGGAGMDAEYLARIGAQVVSSDLSIGATKRARERSAQYGLSMQAIVADAERLPFADHSVDVVMVHDGLHHLADPYVGIAEMARVSRRFILISEPAAAFATRVAIRLGLALEREEAGNKVARLDPRKVSNYLKNHGFNILKTERYAMYYAHQPGPVVRALSYRWTFPIAVLAWRLANALIGRFGNKMVIVAERV